MRVLRPALVLLAMSLFLPALNLQSGDNPLGSQGTLVFRNNEFGYLWFVWDGNQTMVQISTEEDWGQAIYCGTGSWEFGGRNWQKEAIASGKWNSFSNGPLMARVFYPLTPDQIDWNTFCDWLQNPPEPIAEGIVHFNTSDQNTCALGPGRYEWSRRFSGSLINLTAPCAGRRVSVSYEEHYRVLNGALVDPDTCSTDPSNIELIKLSGPTISCIP